MPETLNINDGGSEIRPKALLYQLRSLTNLGPERPQKHDDGEFRVQGSGLL